jgi:hypothetical protein
MVRKKLNLLFWAGVILWCAGCIGPHYVKHQWVLFGKRNPVISGPHDPAIEANLTTNLWQRSLLGPEAGVGVVLFKSMGIQGWEDFHLHAKATGIEAQHQISSSGFLTLDMRLDSLTVEDVPVPIQGTKYIRVEIFLGRVSADKALRHETNELVSAEGKLVWDEDGWFEIHPQRTADVRRLSD